MFATDKYIPNILLSTPDDIEVLAIKLHMY